jgi:NAD+ synthase (glutamine-hydrolysing)
LEKHLPDSSELGIGLIQLDTLVGDIEGNARRAVDAARRLAERDGCRIALLPELNLVGYPPDDLLLRPDFAERIDRAIDWVAQGLADAGIAAVLGAPLTQGERRYNAAVVVDGGVRVAVARKRCLPNYGVFDEKRYFVEGTRATVVDLAGRRLGLIVCEDIWAPEPAREAADRGAEAILCINASPFDWRKPAARRRVARERVSECGIPLVYLNQVGGQDELVFDGDSFVIDHDGRECSTLAACGEDWGTYWLSDAANRGDGPDTGEELEPPDRIYAALQLAVRDYVEKNGFAQVVVGLSGGIDSALTLALAADAVGADRVTAVLMPSRYTARMSIDDGVAEARALGVRYHVLSIERPFEAFLETLAEPFAGRPADATEENLQARSRGVLLMALANKFGALVLSTGNKSELAVGYATLYGDMVGGFAPLKDVPKTRVYELAAWRNECSPMIPPRVLERAPSAELAPDQADTDSLPPYATLDLILEALVERDESVEALVAAGYDEATVRRVARMLVASEYKRRQAAPGPKVSPRAFGRERRYPITARCGF